MYWSSSRHHRSLEFPWRVVPTGEIRVTVGVMASLILSQKLLALFFLEVLLLDLLHFLLVLLAQLLNLLWV